MKPEEKYSDVPLRGLLLAVAAVLLLVGLVKASTTDAAWFVEMGAVGPLIGAGFAALVALAVPTKKG